MDIVVNKKARFRYEIMDDFEAGIVLVGSEVKSLRGKKVNVSDSYATFKNHELFLTNLRIEPYEKAKHFNHEPTRSRKLLMHKKELTKLKSRSEEKGYVIVPLKIYFNQRQQVKVLLGLGKGKKSHDKRQAIKERDIKRDTDREMKQYK